MKNLPALIDKLYDVRQRRLAAQKDVDAMEADERALRIAIFDQLKASPTGAASGALAHAEIKSTPVPQLIDADAFLAWARKSPKRSDVYKVSVSAPAWRTHVSNGDIVPGVESFTREDLSLTKVK